MEKLKKNTALRPKDLKFNPTYAKKFKLPIKEVVSGGDIEKEVHKDTDHGIMVNSSNNRDLDLNGSSIESAIEQVIFWLEKKQLGKRKTQYKLRDWLFSRQRYWGEPIPIIHQTKQLILECTMLHGVDTQKKLNLRWIN